MRIADKASDVTKVLKTAENKHPDSSSDIIKIAKHSPIEIPIKKKKHIINTLITYKICK